MEVNLVPFFLGWQSVLGTTMGNAGEFAAMLAFVERHRLLPPVDRVYPFHRAPEALRHLGRGEQFGKVVLAL